MAKKGEKSGNGLDLANEYLRRILDKLGEVLASQEAMRHEQEAMHREQEAMRHEQEAMRHDQEEMRVHIVNIESSVRQIATFIGKDRIRQDREVEDLKNRVEVLERKVA